MRIDRVIADWLLHMYDLLVGSMHSDDLFALMNGPIRKKLGIIPKHVTWGGRNMYILNWFSLMQLLHDEDTLFFFDWSQSWRNDTGNCPNMNLKSIGNVCSAIDNGNIKDTVQYEQV